MNSDNYEYSKSSNPQSVDAYSCYTDKQWNYTNDINQGVYSNNSGLTQVQFDMSSIYNSNGFVDTSDLYLTIPIVMTAAFSTAAGVTVTPVSGNNALLTMKSNYQNLVHQIEIQCDGKTINETQPFVNVFQNFRMLSQMSVGDLQAAGTSLGFSSTLDNEKSVQFNSLAGAAAGSAGQGLCNNIPFVSSTVVGGDFTPVEGVNQNKNCVNTAITKRISRIVDTTAAIGASNNKLYGTAGATGTGSFIMSATNLATEFKPYYTVVGNVMIWYDVAILPLKYLTDCMDKIGLVRKLSTIFRLYLNTGSLAVTVPALSTVAGTVATYYGAFNNSTFANTCPFTVNYLPDYSTVGGIPATTAVICAGLFVARAPTTSIPTGTGSVNIGNGVPSHAMPSCRCYYALVKMEPSKALMYVEQNRNKLVVYEQLITNQYNNIASNASFSQLVQSGIKNPLAICIIPFISASTPTAVGGSTGLGFYQWASPFDTCPSTYSPCSLSNLQITLGGQNILNSTLFYSYESFLEQVMLADNLTSSDLGIGTGLINQSWWEQIGRVYWIDLKRSREADKASTRNLNISFTNNSQVPIDCLVATFYLDKLIIDVETGSIKK